MASRFWVGGTGTWDATTTTHWSATSGGAGGASVPGTTDNVFLDGNSGVGTISIGASAVNSQDLVCTGYAGTLSGGVNVFGSLVLSTTMTLTAGTQGWSFKGTAGGTTITSAGKTFPNNVFIDCTTGSYTLADAATMSLVFNLTSGTFSTAGFALTFGTFSSTVSNVRTLNITNSTVTVTGGSGTTAWDTGVGTNMTLTSTGSTVVFTAVSPQMRASGGNGKVYNNVTFNGGGPNAGIGNNITIGTLTVTGTAAKTGLFFITTSSTIANLVVNGNSPVNRILFCAVNSAGNGQGVGSQVNITVTTSVTLNNVDFADIRALGAAGTWTGTSLGDAGGNSNITFDAPLSLYRVGAGANWSTSGWALSSNGATGQRVPLPQDTVVVDANNSGTITLDMPRVGGSLNFTGFAGTLSFASVNNTLFGSLVLSPTTTVIGTFAGTFGGRGSYVINLAGKSLPNAWVVSAPGGTYTLTADYAQSVSTASFSVTAGTFDAAGFNVSVGAVSSTGSATRSLRLGSGTWFLTTTAATNSWLVSSTGMTLVAGTATIAISTTSANTRTFAGAGLTYSALTYTVANSPGALALTGANSFSALNIGPGRQLILPSLTTTAFGSPPAWAGSPYGSLYLPGVAGNYASTPAAAAINLTASIDVIVNAALATWTPAATNILVSKFGALGARSWAFFVDTAGKLNFQFSSDGSATTTATSTVATGLAAGAASWVRVTRASTTGVVVFYTSSDGTTWTQLGATVNTATSGLFNASTQVLEIGTSQTGTSGPTAGQFYRAQVYNGIAGTLVFDANFAAKPFGANTFIESSTNAATVTINGAVAQAGDGRVSITASTAGSVAQVRPTAGASVPFAADYLTLKDIQALPAVAMTDTFTRANSATALGAASDGGTWLIKGNGLFGISTNRGYLPTYSATNGELIAGAGMDIAYRDLGSVSADVSALVTRSSTTNYGALILAYDPVAGNGYVVFYDSSTWGRICRFETANNLTQLAGTTLFTTFSGATTIRATYNAATGVITVYQNGTQVAQVTDPTPVTGAGNTNVGFGSSIAAVDTWANWAAYPPSNTWFAGHNSIDNGNNSGWAFTDAPTSSGQWGHVLI